MRAAPAHEEIHCVHDSVFIGLAIGLSQLLTGTLQQLENCFARLAIGKEMQGQKLFFGKARCAECHPAPFYTDNLMHDLQVERFYKTQTINGLVATKQGPIKTFPLRGIKESPPYFHDGRLLTLEDTVEFFNLILELNLAPGEKKALVAFMRQL